MATKFSVSCIFLQLFSLSGAHSPTFLFIETKIESPLREERAFYESCLRAKVAQLPIIEDSFDEDPEQAARARLERDLTRFDDFTSHPAVDRYLMKVQTDKHMVALIVFAFNKKHEDRPVWIGPVALSPQVDQRELWHACKEEARKRGGLTFIPGLNKKAVIRRSQSGWESSPQSSPDSVFSKELYISPEETQRQKSLLTRRESSGTLPPFVPMRARTRSEGSEWQRRGSFRKLLEEKLAMAASSQRPLMVPTSEEGTQNE
jgi:hypothetical protein